MSSSKPAEVKLDAARLDHWLSVGAVPSQTVGELIRQVRAEMRKTSHHPVREGKMECTSCHNPHGTVTQALLKETSANDTCFTCHMETRGPCVHNHPPVQEDCAICHQPPRPDISLHVDHDHNSDDRRGFIAKGCEWVLNARLDPAGGVDHGTRCERSVKRQVTGHFGVCFPPASC